MTRILTVFAMSIFAASCAGKSGENVAGSEAAGKQVGGITVGAVFSISTGALQKAVQTAVGTSEVFIGDQLKYFGPSRSGGLHQFKLLGNLGKQRDADLVTPYVANLTLSVLEQLKHFPVSQQDFCRLDAGPCWTTAEQRFADIYVPVDKNVVAQSCYTGGYVIPLPEVPNKTWQAGDTCQSGGEKGKAVRTKPLDGWGNLCVGPYPGGVQWFYWPKKSACFLIGSTLGPRKGTIE